MDSTITYKISKSPLTNLIAKRYFKFFSYISGTNLLYEATHQIGHVLGLSHTDDKESIMWPYHKGFIPGLALSKEDIRRVQEIHGKN